MTMSKRVELIDLGFEKHECSSKKEGDWIIFSCTQCDYVRRFNWKTREVKVENGNLLVLHKGSHVPVGLDSALTTLN